MTGLDPLARLRHDLRTPIGHILGYGDILLEDSGRLGPDALGLVAALKEDGHALLGRVDRALAEPGEGPGPDALAALGRDLLPVLERVDRRAADLARALGPDGPGRDAVKIASAAARLRAMVGERLLPGDP